MARYVFFFVLFSSPLGADYFLRTSFSVTIEAFLLRIRDVLWDGLKSELSNWTYRAKVPDYLAVRFTNNGGYSHNLSPKRERGGGRGGRGVGRIFWGEHNIVFMRNGAGISRRQ